MISIKVVLFYIQNFKDNTYLNEIKNKIKEIGYEVLDVDLSYIMKSEFTTQEILIVTNYSRCLQLSRKLQYNICYIPDIKDLSYDYVYDFIKYYESPNNGIVQKTIFKKKLNIIVTLDLDKTFFKTNANENANEIEIKDEIENEIEKNPLITIYNKPLVSWVVENIKVDGNYYFVVTCSIDHEDYGLDNLLYSLVPDCKIIKTKRRPEGPACYLLEVEKYIENDYPIIITNDRQWLKWDCEKFLFDFLIRDPDSIVQVITFLSNGSNKYNYVKIDSNGSIIDLRRNLPISSFAVTGTYFWKSTKNLYKYIHKMVCKNRRIKGEFCIDPILNELIDEISNDSRYIIESYNEKLKDVETKYIGKDVNRYQDQIISEINIIENAMQKDLKSKNRITKRECLEFIELNNIDDINMFKNYLIEQKMTYVTE